MKTKLVAFLLAAGAMLAAWAERVPSDLAARAVNSLIAQEGQMESPIRGTVSSVRLCTATNGAAFYVAKLSDGGFVVTSTDTEIDPIVAISTESDLVEDPQNPLWALLVGDMAARQESLSVRKKAGARLMSAIGSEDESGSSPAARWARLIESGDSTQSAGAGKGVLRALGASSGKSSSISDVRVAPLLKTKWGQSYDASGKRCFNYYTPNNYLCGCTATAGAQILRYHKFPTEPVEPKTYECYVDWEYHELKQKGGVYDWNNMPNVPGSGTSDKQRRAIGKLTYDVSVAVSFYYTATETDGVLSKFVNLCHEWGYAHATTYYDSGHKFTKNNLKSVLIPNLDAKLPVGVGLANSAGGHYVVADGYGYLSGQFSVHLNFGWKGASDAWYVLPGTIAEGGGINTPMLLMSTPISIPTARGKEGSSVAGCCPHRQRNRFRVSL